MSVHFTTEEIVFIYKQVKRALDDLQGKWRVKFDLREKQIDRAVSEAIFNLPRTPGGN